MKYGDMLFGAPSADNDSLLQECIVSEQLTKTSKPILVGRWGTGKTATIVMRNSTLEAVLRSIDETSGREWHIREQDLDPEALFVLQDFYITNEARLVSALQKIWKIEIYRRTVRILALLHQAYDIKSQVNSEEWKTILILASRETAKSTMWSSIENIVKIFSKDTEQKKDFLYFSMFFKALGEENTKLVIQKCIREIESMGKTPPAIGIEPIETPASSLDKEVSLSKAMIASLVNAFRNDFILSTDQRLRVDICIPWNRLENNLLNLPQHIAPYTDEVRNGNLITLSLWRSNFSSD